jgi:hypothetical protein
MLRVVGIAALIVLATACDQTAVKTVPSPSPVIAAGNWDQTLSLAGDVKGQMTGIVPDTATQQSACTGSKSRNGDTWSDYFYGTIDASGTEWGIVFLIANFRGQGTYQNEDVAITLRSFDNAQVWLNQAADPATKRAADKVTFVMERGQQSGLIDANLTNATSGKSGSEHLTGRWNCKG